MSAFRDRTAVVTGAASGIGRAIARRLAAEGARVALLDRNEAGAKRAAAELGLEEGARALRCDVTEPGECDAAMAAVREAWGGIDLLVNNAGITHVGRFRETRTEVLRRVMDVNFFGALHCTRAALPALLERRGRVLVISSVAGLAPLATRSGYAASKHALHGFFASLRAEHRAEGLGVTLVCPAYVDTAIDAGTLGPDGRPAPPGARTGVRDPISPEEVAEAALRAAARRRRLVWVPARARLYTTLFQLAPALYERWMTRRSRS